LWRRPRPKLGCGVKEIRRKKCHGDIDLLNLVQVRIQWLCCFEHGNEPSGSGSNCEILDQLSDY
jgi:hypothetical protein